MNDEVTRDAFLRRLRQNVAALREPPSFGNLRTGQAEASATAISQMKEQRTRAREKRLAAQLRADLQRSRPEYSDVLRASQVALEKTGEHPAPATQPAKPSPDVEARRHVTAPLLSLFHIFMRRQRVANRLACLNGHRTVQQQPEAVPLVPTVARSDDFCGVTGAGPFVFLPPPGTQHRSAVASTDFETPADSGVSTLNHHYVNLRPPQPLRKPLVFRQAHYHAEPIPEFCIDVQEISEKELDLYRSHPRTTSGAPCLQHFVQPLTTMETFAPSATYSLRPINALGDAEYRPHTLTDGGSRGYAGVSHITARAQVDAHLAPSSITVDANLSTMPEKLEVGCAEDSMSDDDEDLITQQCNVTSNPAWLPSQVDSTHCGAATDSPAAVIAPPSTFVSFLHKFA